MTENEKLRALLAEALAEVGRLHARIEHIAASHVEALRLTRREAAEAMREAVAQLFDGTAKTPGLAHMPLWAAEIRALPLPKEES